MLPKPLLRLSFLAPVIAAALLGAPRRDGQRTFATPQDAARALMEASENNDPHALLRIFGPEGRSIVFSGDPAEDREIRAQFARMSEERLQIREDAGHDTVVVGSDESPFPVPLVETSGQWRFDAARAKPEVLARRIGRNEAIAIAVCRGYVAAQTDYAARNHRYAQKIVSSPGKSDGLYQVGAPRSPAPETFAEAAAAMSAQGRRTAPFRGYYFRILKAQGPDADGGAEDYVVKGEMTGGFALVAYPAEYGVSGIRTFMVNQKALVYGKDVGAATVALGRRMLRFNPDQTWKAVALE